MQASKPHKIAVIAGDGIGKEVMPEGIRVLDAAARRFGIELQWDHFDFASAEYYQAHGKMLPDDWFETLKDYDALYFGAVGWPDVVPDHISLWGSLLQFRRRFDLMALQRNLKALGTFGYQTMTRSNPVYIKYMPRTLHYARTNLDKYPRFAGLRELLAPRVEELA